MKVIVGILLWVFGFMAAALLSVGLVELELEAEPTKASPAAMQSRQSEPELVPGSPAASLEETLDQAGAEEQPLVSLFEQVSPSVVNIAVFSARGSGAGSGFVIDSDGHIVTNNHVVEDAEMVLVRFADETVVEAELVGADVESDLAVVRVDVSEDLLKEVRLGDSSTLRVGQPAIAVGRAFSCADGLHGPLGYLTR